MTVERAFLQQRKIIKFRNCFVIIQAEKVLVYYCFPLKRWTNIEKPLCLLNLVQTKVGKDAFNLGFPTVDLNL
jgi:hypothetical protein